MAIPAHKDDRGSKRATMVNAREPAWGNEGKDTYWRDAKIATLVSRVISRKLSPTLTRYDHGTATHCS